MSGDGSGEIIASKAGNAPSTIVGYIDRVDGVLVAGWAWDRARPDLALDIEIHVDGRLAATARADVLRKDLAEAGYGNGAHAFTATLTEPVPAAERERVTAFAHDGSDGVRVPMVNRKVEQRPAQAAQPTKAPETALWLDEATRMQRSFEQAIKIAAQEIGDAVHAFRVAAKDGEAGEAEAARELQAAFSDLGAMQAKLARQIESVDALQTRGEAILRALERPRVASNAGGGVAPRLAMMAVTAISGLSLIVALWSLVR